LDTQAEHRKLSSLTLYIDLWQEAKPAPGQNPPVISPPVVIFRRIGVRAEIRTDHNSGSMVYIDRAHIARIKYKVISPNTIFLDAIFFHIANINSLSTGYEPGVMP
jgi:hypothetical protein